MGMQQFIRESITIREKIEQKKQKLINVHHVVEMKNLFSGI